MTTHREEPEQGPIEPDELGAAWRRLEAKGLGGLGVSMRPTAHGVLGAVVHGERRRLAFGERSGEPQLVLHAEIYRRRPDVGAIVVARPHWASALGLVAPMPGIFDEQVRQLGRRVERLTELGQLGSRHCAFLWADEVLCLGVTLDRAVFNVELVEKCAQAYLLAMATGQRVFRVPLWVREIAFHRLKGDQARAAEAWARGETPSGFTAY